MSFVSGQRYINSADLQLGLGRVVAENHRMVKVAFDAVDEERIYAKESAPLTRYVLSVGDSVRHKDGWEMVIEAIKELNGLNIYLGTTADGQEEVLPETEIANTISLDRPAERLFNAQIDKHRWFQLRQQARRHQLRLQSAETYGLAGCRTALLPHQLYIAHAVGKRYAPRVLLADEVGLGKTIEAGLIIHQQMLTGRAKRILIMVPDSLVHQWLVELLRRFNLSFGVFDEEKCLEIESSEASNPFESTQCALIPQSLLLDNPQRAEQALTANWDILVVDEAHHLHWDESSSSEAYQLVEKLAAQIPGVLLLTATPEQLGRKSHFARLRLLDPDRYHDYAHFVSEEEHFAPVADAIEQLLDSHVDALADLKLPADDAQSKQLWAKVQETTQSIEDRQHSRNELVDHLLDQHGTGRILYRNTRASVSGFPERKLQGYPLTQPAEYENLADGKEPISGLYPEIEYQQNNETDWRTVDPRVEWLIERIKQCKHEKLLVIAAHASTVLQLEAWLREKQGIHAAVFHEHLSLVERDQAAAWFADMENGSQLLLCSEIGSEGRNFQFAHQLLLFDLPANPDLLEQRIGRLDRIGQTETIQIHVPYLKDSLQQRWFEWYHSGLNIFEKTNPAAAMLFAEMSEQLLSDNALSEIIATTQKRSDALLAQMQQGRDRLLEYNSCRPSAAEKLVDAAAELEQSVLLEQFMHEAFDLFGVHFEEHRAGSEIIRPTDEMHGYFPFVQEDGSTITYDREVALANENMHFITWEHPMVVELLELILTQEKGNTALVALQGSGLPPGQLMVESRYHVQASGSADMQLSRYFPALDQRLLITESGQDVAAKLVEKHLKKFFFQVPKKVALQVLKAKLSEVKQAIKVAEQKMLEALPEKLAKAQTKLEHALDGEIQRLKQLAEKNASVRSVEIEHLQQLKQRAMAALQETQPQLDSVRIIVTM